MPSKNVQTETPKFEIVYRDILLATANRGQPNAKTITGDVARLSDGRMVSRVRGVDADGETIFGFDEFNPDPNVRGDHGVMPYQNAAALNQELEILRCGPRVATLNPTEERQEFARLKAEYPFLWKRLKLDEDFAQPIFATGEVSYPQLPKPPFTFALDWVRECVDRHASGDFGANGLADTSTLTEEERWLSSSLPRARANVAAAQLRTGVVVSDYLLSDAAQVEWRRLRFNVIDRGALRITTLVRPTGNRTLARIVPVGA